MNALQRAKESLHELARVLHLASQVRMATTGHSTSKLPPPRATQLRVAGSGMIRVVDADTGKVLGFRCTIREARWLADALVRGDAQHPAQ